MVSHVEPFPPPFTFKDWSELEGYCVCMSVSLEKGVGPHPSHSAGIWVKGIGTFSGGVSRKGLHCLV